MQTGLTQAAPNSQAGAAVAEPRPLGHRHLVNIKTWPSLRILLSAHLLVPFALIALSIFVGIICLALLLAGSAQSRPLDLIMLSSLLIAGCALWVLLVRLRNQLLLPLTDLENTVSLVCQGESAMSHISGKAGVLSGLAKDIDSISEELSDIYEDMQVRVGRQTARLAQKTTALKILYDVAAGINHAEDLDELLMEYLQVCKRMVNARSATVHLVLADDRVRLVGCVDQFDALYRESQLRPIQLCHCGTALSPGDILCPHDAPDCSARNGRRMYSSREIERVTVPFWYHGDVLGFYRLYVRKPGVFDGPEDVLDILNTIGGHLGMAVAKQRSDEEARRLSIVEERTALAHELHDSLAQTLASLRYQVRMLEETLQKSQATTQAQYEAQRIHNGLDEAHDELRELINSFRAPIQHRGLVAALESLVERFRRETGIAIFFHSDREKVALDNAQAMQAVRIVQEALANIRKHANAHTVRVLLRSCTNGDYLVLVEDDGAGFDNASPEGNPGEHIGLTIMEERAHRIGGLLTIETEPGEGTRVELIIQAKQERGR